MVRPDFACARSGGRGAGGRRLTAAPVVRVDFDRILMFAVRGLTLNIRTVPKCIYLSHIVYLLVSIRVEIQKTGSKYLPLHRRREIRDQAQTDAEFVKLEVRMEKCRRTINAGLAGDFGHVDSGFAQWMGR